MEPWDLAVGITSCVVSFTACINEFKYIQFGRQFGQDDGKYLLQLDAVNLRMSRSGTVIWLGPEPHLELRIPVSHKEIRRVQSLLDKIGESF